MGKNKDWKICLTRRSHKIGHALAYLLKERYGVKKFYDHSCPRRDEKFFKSPKNVSYSPLFVVEDLFDKVKTENLDLSYIKFLEKEYGLPSLWPYIDSDRHLMLNYPKLKGSGGAPVCSHEEMLKHLQVGFREIQKALEEKKPDCIIFLAVGGMDSRILFHVAKKMGIKIIEISLARVKDRMILLDNYYEEFPRVYQIFDSLRQGSRQSLFKKEAVAFLKEFREGLAFSYSQVSSKPISLFRKLGHVVRYFLLCFYCSCIRKDDKKCNYRKRNLNPLDYFKKRWIKIWEKWRVSKGLFEDPRELEDFAFFPLHVQPELALSLLAPYYSDQVALVRNIAKSLPVHFKLYVKEHPGMFHRQLSYYEELKRIPNVRLIKTEIESSSLIKKAKIVLTITGTCGWEAVLYKKPVITFGRVFYNKLSMVKRCQSPEKLPLIIKECLEDYHHQEEELIDFISAIFECSTPLDFVYLYEKAPFEEIIENENFKKFVDFLAKELGLEKIN